MKKIIALLVLALIGALILSSCGKKDDPRQDPPMRDWLDGRDFEYTQYDAHKKPIVQYQIDFARGQARLKYVKLQGDRRTPPYSVRTIEAHFVYRYEMPNCLLMSGVAFESIKDYDEEGTKTERVKNRKFDFAETFGDLSLYVDEASKVLLLHRSSFSEEVIRLR